MPTIEIMSPLSDNLAPATFWVVGEDDIPRAEKKDKAGPFTIKVAHRKTSAGGAFTVPQPAQLLPNGVWRCQLMLSGPEKYDIQATLFDGASPTTETDLVTNVQVSGGGGGGGGGPIIEVDEMPRMMAEAASDFAPAPTGRFRRNGIVYVQIIRFDLDKKHDAKPLKKRNRVVGCYNTGLSYQTGTTGTWHLYDTFRQIPITQVRRCKGKDKSFVVVATLIDPRDWSVLGTATSVIDQS